MNDEQKHVFPQNTPAETVLVSSSRRRFLGLAGALAGAGLLGLSSCTKDDNQPAYESGVNLGSGDAGVLNYIYALKQLTSAFYRQVAESGGSVFPERELLHLKEIAAHEAGHARFLQEWMMAQGIAPLQAISGNFSTVNFGNRADVLQTAQTLEDLSVAAGNGAGKLLKRAPYLLMLGKIGSVDARHAAYIRDLRSNGSFADLTDLSAIGAQTADGLDAVLTPGEVLNRIGKYSRQRLNASKLPSY